MWADTNVLEKYIVSTFSISALNMGTVRFSETLVSAYESTRRYNAEDQHRQLDRPEKLKSHLLLLFTFTLLVN
jgi:hypothetical protein